MTKLKDCPFGDRVMIPDQFNELDDSARMVKHPAKFTDKFIPIFADKLKSYRNVFDPFAGTGKLAHIKKFGYEGRVICGEIEPEWAKASVYDVDEWIIGDSSCVNKPDNSFHAICTSPTYGNRMADHFNASDTSKRVTYRHYLGRSLNVNNSGRMQWGDKYRTLHEKVYSECKRLLCTDGVLIINISNHIRQGCEVDVVSWHNNTLINLGFTLKEKIKLLTPRMRFGSNSKTRVKYEYILLYTL